MTKGEQHKYIAVLRKNATYFYGLFPELFDYLKQLSLIPKTKMVRLEDSSGSQKQLEGTWNLPKLSF
jgi:hypothetical protein